MSYEMEIKELLEKYKLNFCLKGENTKIIKNNIKTEINKINDKELEEEIKTGRKTKMMHDYNKKISRKSPF